MDIVDVIVSKTYDKGTKLIKLYSIAMLNYREPLGDKAWEEIDKLFGDKSLTTSFSFLMGYASGKSDDSLVVDRLKQFIQDEMKEAETDEM